MQTSNVTSSIVLLSALACASALAETDRKVLPGAICQAEHAKDRGEKDGRPILVYMARGLFAAERDVPVTCPLLRDSTLSALNRVEVRFARGLKQPGQGGSDGQFLGDFKGILMSCSNREITAPCAEDSGVSSKDFRGDTTTTVPIVWDSIKLPFGEERSYAFKGVIPKGTVLMSITYSEVVK
jgi:hypothetical protein